MEPFRIAVNMAGAVSAGAYTAGVLDFLIEALDEWEAAKARGESVPAHRVQIEALTGASAGGMCAAIAAASLLSAPEPASRLHRAWVEEIDIARLLATTDLQRPLTSLLNSAAIDEIAAAVIRRGAGEPRPYVSPALAIRLTLTNLTGVVYALYEGHSLAPDEFVSYHADAFRTEAPALTSDAQWALLREAAKATGAFPGFLAARVLPRGPDDCANPAAGAPRISPGNWQAACVDGGVIDNSPFALAVDHLRGLDPGWQNSAIITVAPFPAQCATPGIDPSLGAVVSALLSTLLAQARFFGESLATVTGGPTSNRYFIAPSGAPLQCGTLGAFGGFFEKSFREHDYQLGRRNCQRFLETSLLKPGTNQPLIPLTGRAAAEIPQPQPGAISRAAIDEIAGLIAARANAVVNAALARVKSGTLRLLIRTVVKTALALKGKRAIRDYLYRNLPVN